MIKNTLNKKQHQQQQQITANNDIIFTATSQSSNTFQPATCQHHQIPFNSKKQPITSSNTNSTPPQNNKFNNSLRQSSVILPPPPQTTDRQLTIDDSNKSQQQQQENNKQQTRRGFLFRALVPATPASSQKELNRAKLIPHTTTSHHQQPTNNIGLKGSSGGSSAQSSLSSPSSSSSSSLLSTIANSQQQSDNTTSATNYANITNGGRARGRSRVPVSHQLNLDASAASPESTAPLRSSSLSVANRVQAPIKLTRFRFSSGKNWRRSASSQKNANQYKQPSPSSSVASFSSSIGSQTLAAPAPAPQPPPPSERPIANKQQTYTRLSPQTPPMANHNGRASGEQQASKLEPSDNKNIPAGGAKRSQSLTTSSQGAQQASQTGKPLARLDLAANNNSNNNNNNCNNGGLIAANTAAATAAAHLLLSSSSVSSSSASSTASNSINSSSLNNQTNSSSSPSSSRSSSSSAVTTEHQHHSINVREHLPTTINSTANRQILSDDSKTTVHHASMPPPAAPHFIQHRRNASSSSSGNMNNEHRKDNQQRKKRSSVDSYTSTSKQQQLVAASTSEAQLRAHSQEPKGTINDINHLADTNQDGTVPMVSDCQRDNDTAIEGENGPKMGLVTGIFFKVWSLVKVAKSKRHRNQRASEPDTASNFEYISGEQASQQYPLGSTSSRSDHGSQLTILSPSSINNSDCNNRVALDPLAQSSSASSFIRNASSPLCRNHQSDSNNSMSSVMMVPTLINNNKNSNNFNNKKSKKSFVKKSATTTLNGHELANSHIGIIPQVARIPSPSTNVKPISSVTTDQQQQILSVGGAGGMGGVSRPVVVSDQAGKLYPITKSFSTNNFFSYQDQQLQLQQQQQQQQQQQYQQHQQNQLQQHSRAIESRHHLKSSNSKPIIISHHHMQNFNAIQNTLQGPISTTSTNLPPMSHHQQQQHKPTGSASSAGSRSVLSTQSSLSTGDTSSISSSASAATNDNRQHINVNVDPMLDGNSSAVAGLFNQHANHQQPVIPLQIKSGIHYHGPHRNETILFNRKQQQPPLMGYYNMMRGNSISRPASLMLTTTRVNDNWCMTPTGQLQYQASIAPGQFPPASFSQNYPAIFSPDQQQQAFVTSPNEMNSYVVAPSYQQQHEQTFNVNRRAPQINEPVWASFDNCSNSTRLYQYNQQGQPAVMLNRRQFPSSVVAPSIHTRNRNQFKMSSSVSMNSFQTAPTSYQSSSSNCHPIALTEQQQQLHQQKGTACDIDQKRLFFTHQEILNELILKNQSHFQDPFLESIKPLIPLQQPVPVEATTTERENIYDQTQREQTTITFKKIEFHIHTPIDYDNLNRFIDEQQQRQQQLNSNHNMNSNPSPMAPNKQQQENFRLTQCQLALERENVNMLRFKRRPRLSRKLYKLIKSLVRFEFIKANAEFNNNNGSLLLPMNIINKQHLHFTANGENRTLYHVVISGTTGSGKTSFVRHLVENAKRFQQQQLENSSIDLNVANQSVGNSVASQLNLFAVNPASSSYITSQSSQPSSLKDEYQIKKAEKILSSQLLAYHYCQAHDYATKNTADFIQNLLHQIVSHNSLRAYKELLSSQDANGAPNYREILSEPSCLKDPIKALQEGLINPLNSLWNQGKIIMPKAGMPFLIVLDALEEACRLGACPNHPQPFDGPTRIDAGSCQSSACSDDDTFTTPPINQPTIDEAKRMVDNENQQVPTVFLKCDNPIGKLLANIVGLFPYWIKFIITINSSHLCFRNLPVVASETNITDTSSDNLVVWKHLSLDVNVSQRSLHDNSVTTTLDHYNPTEDVNPLYHQSSTEEFTMLQRDVDLLAYIQTRTKLWSPSLFERLTTHTSATVRITTEDNDKTVQDGKIDALISAKQGISPRRRAIKTLINYLTVNSHGSFFYCDLLLEMIESKKISFDYTNDNQITAPFTNRQIVMRLDKQFAQSISRGGWNYLFRQRNIIAKNQQHVKNMMDNDQQLTFMKQLDLPNEFELDELFYFYMEFKFPQIRSRWFNDQATVIMQILMAATCTCASTNLNQIQLFMVLNAGQSPTSSQTTTLETNPNGQNAKKSDNPSSHEVMKRWKAFESTLNELSCAHLIKLHKASGQLENLNPGSQRHDAIEHLTNNLCFMFQHDSIRQWLSSCHPALSASAFSFEQQDNNPFNTNNERPLIVSQNNNHRFNMDATYGHYCLAKWLLLPHHTQSMEQPALSDQNKNIGGDIDDDEVKQLFREIDPSLISLLIRKRQSVYDSNNGGSQRSLNSYKCLQIAAHAVHCFVSSCRRRRSSSTTSFNWTLSNGASVNNNQNSINQNRSIDSGISNMATNTINSSLASQFKESTTLDPLPSPTLFSGTESQTGLLYNLNDELLCAQIQSRRRSLTNQLITTPPATSNGGSTNLDPLASPWFDELLGILCDQDETLLSGALSLGINLFDPQLEASRLLLSAGANANVNIPVGIVSSIGAANPDRYPLILMMTERNDLEFVKLLLQFQADPDPCILSSYSYCEKKEQKENNHSEQNNNKLHHLLISNPSLIAAQKGYTEILKLLVEHGASDRITPRNIKLLKAIAYIDDKLFAYYHPLLVATCFNHKEIVDYLIDHLYYVYCVSDNSGHQEEFFLNLLHQAIVISCFMGHHQIFEVLMRYLRFCLKQSKNTKLQIKNIINKCDEQIIGHTPLTAAVSGSNLDICRSLIKDFGAQVIKKNMINQTPLCCFLATMHPINSEKLSHETEILEIVHLLMRVNVDSEALHDSSLKSMLDNQDKPFGFTALIHAARVLTTTTGYTNVNRIIGNINYRPSNIRDSISTSTEDSSDDTTSGNEKMNFVSPGISLEDNLSSKIVKILIKYKANVNLTDIQGSSALMHAIQCDNFRSVQYIIESEQVDINIRNELNMSAIDYVCLHGRRVKMLKMLIDNGANFEYKDDNGMRLLDRVIAKYSPDSHDKMVLIEFLLKNGAKLGSKTWDAANGKMNILDVLLRKLCQDGYYLYKKMQIDAAVYRFEYALNRLALIEHKQAPFSRLINERNLRMDPHFIDHNPRNQLFDEAILESMQQTKYQLYLGLSRCERKRKNYMKALEDAHMSILIESSSYEGYFSKAQILKDLGEYHDALVAIEQASNLIDKTIIEIMNELNQNVPGYEHNSRSICEKQMTENAEYLMQARKYVHNLKSEIISAKHLSSSVLTKDKTHIAH